MRRKGGGASPSRAGEEDDPRVRRTRRALVEAYLSLASEREPGSFGVVDIARRAGLNRATFYRHFESEADLRERGLPLVLAELARSFPAEDAGPGWKGPAGERVARILAQVLARPEAFGLAAGEGADDQSFWEGSLAFLERFLREERLPSLGGRLAVPSALASRLMTCLLAGLVSWAREHPREADPRSLALLYVEIVDRGLMARSGEGEEGS